MDTCRPLRTAVITTVALAVLTALVAIRWSPLVQLDERIATATYFFGIAHPGWVQAQLVITTVLGPWPWRVLIIVLAVRLYLRQQRRAASLMFTPILVGGVLSSLLKLAVGRPRPAFAHPFDYAAGAAFPSGHATTAAIGCAVLALTAPPHLRVLALMAGAVIAGLVGWTRIGLDVHWASDVVGGWLLGVAVVAFTLVWGGPRTSTPSAERDLQSP